MNGNPPRKFGKYEARQVTSTKTLWLALAAAVVSWGISYVVPMLEAYGETAAAFGAILAVVLRILAEWCRDNTEQRHGSKENNGSASSSERDAGDE